LPYVSGWVYSGELLKLGFDVSERTISRYFRRLSPPDQLRKLWAAFLRNHYEVITAMDFFTVPDRYARLVSLRRIGGLHHRYDWQQAA
jgi:hypothetical protein